MRSLLIKCAMLAVTSALVYWVWWQAPQIFGDERSVAGEPGPSHSRASSGEGEKVSVEQPSERRANGASPLAARARQSLSPQRDLIDLNRANVEDLGSLPGIGPVLAQRVIAYRTSIGRFSRIEELQDVKGIGSKTFARIKPLVTVVGSGVKGKVETPL
jgi:competence protein ComEA